MDSPYTSTRRTATQSTVGATLSRRNVLRAIGAGVASAGLFSSGAAGESDGSCELTPCVERFLMAPVPGVGLSQWEVAGQPIKENQPEIKVGTQIVGVDDPAPVAFDPIVTCVRAGTTVRWDWINQKTVAPKIPETVHHNVDIFQYSEDCTYKEGSFVSSGPPVGFNPPHAEKPESFEHTFDEPGVFPYYCEPHGYPDLEGLPAEATDDTSHHGEQIPPNVAGMRGAVIVTE